MLAPNIMELIYKENTCLSYIWIKSKVNNRESLLYIKLQKAKSVSCSNAVQTWPNWLTAAKKCHKSWTLGALPEPNLEPENRQTYQMKIFVSAILIAFLSSSFWKHDVQTEISGDM